MTRQRLPYAVAPASDADLGGLVAVEEECFSHPWTRAHFRQALRSRTQRLVVLKGPPREGDPAGGLLGYVCVEIVAGEMEIHNVAVRPSLRGHGLGRVLLRVAVSLGARGGAETAFLEVRRSNRSALDLYRKAGFRQVGVRRNYYTRPTEDALVLRKDGLDGQH